jgi:MFS family permease
MAVEHSPTGRRGFYGSWPQIGVPAGLLLSASAVYLLSYLSDADFLVWGWRIAFLISRPGLAPRRLHSFEHVLQHGFVEGQVGHHPLQSTVLFLELASGAEPPTA